MARSIFGKKKVIQQKHKQKTENKPTECTLPVKSLDTPSHSMVFLYFELFSTL